MPRTQTTAFLTLTLWTASAWITAEALPSQLPVLAAQGFHFFLLALATAIFAAARKHPRPTPGTLFWTASTGLALIAAPLVLLESATGMVSSSVSVAVFALLPIVVVVAQGQMRWLIPSLAGVTGLLLLLPVSLPATSKTYLGLALTIAAMAFTAGAILFLHRDKLDAWGAAAIFLANAVVLALVSRTPIVLSLHNAAYESLRCVLLTAPEFLLLLWLVTRLDPRRLAARWLLAPLVTVTEGFLLMHLHIDARSIIGLALLAGGGVILFAANEEAPEALRLT